MLNQEIGNIIAAFKTTGWVLEPEAKRLLSLAGITVPRFRWAKSPGEALEFTAEIGYPVVAKVVSPRLLHKSDAGGVMTGIDADEKVKAAFDRFRRFDGFEGMLVEETLSGIELIVGARVDYQFGPVILLGMGGIRAEIYRDVSLRMAPLKPGDAELMVSGLRGCPVLEGFRGVAPVNMEELSGLLLKFSGLVMELGESIESVDLNPVMCSATGCVVADARIMLPAMSPAGDKNR